MVDTYSIKKTSGLGRRLQLEKPLSTSSAIKLDWDLSGNVEKLACFIRVDLAESC
jgi:hypothetical protein